MSEFVLGFRSWNSVTKLVHLDFIICSQFSIIVIFYEIIRFRLYRFVLGFKVLILGYYAIIIFMIPEFVLFITVTLL